MKFLSVFLLLSFSTASFAQHVLDCKIAIKTNKTRRDLKDLRESSIERRIELFEGQEQVETFRIDRLIAHPGRRKTDSYLIRVFSEDKRDQEISRDKNVTIRRLRTTESVKFTVKHDGEKTKVLVETNRGKSRLRFKGVGTTDKASVVAYSRFNYTRKGKAKSSSEAIVTTCQMIPKEIINEEMIKNGGSVSTGSSSNSNSGVGR